MSSSAQDINSQAVVTADGVPLMVSLSRAKRKAQIRALLLVTPLFLFILLTFFIPIASMLLRSVDNTVVSEALDRTVPLLQGWDQTGDTLPDEAIFVALHQDFVDGYEEKTIGSPGRRLNYEKPGFSSLFRGTARNAKKFEPPYQAAFIKEDAKWGDINYWRVLKRESRLKTDSYYLSAIDYEYNNIGERISKPSDESIYLTLFGRTFWISLVITSTCLILAFPISYLLSTLPARSSNMLMILVLLPFWTSLLVRTSAWIALLQQEGVINDLLVGVGLLSDENRLAMIHNQAGTIIAMVHVLLPFMVLPLYSVMKTIPPTYMRAARSLGANPFTAFTRVYMPGTVPGIGAGCILVFIISIGYYITPALVGGQSGTLISNFIAYHLSSSLNWGLAAALGTLLLAAVFALYILYDKLVGIDNMKLG
ncbi:MAG: putative spermidine/putrescine transport system permease protein [Gammaproteobacteria bacterium]|jgi:putative spermidine/putrescine transport system permease protein